MSDEAPPGSGTMDTRKPTSSEAGSDDDGTGIRHQPVDGRRQQSSDTRGTRHTDVAQSRAGSMWVGSILAALVLILLLVFILQNRVPVEIHFFGWAGTLPSGVALLLAAVAGLLVVAIPGSVRMMQLRRTARKNRD